MRITYNVKHRHEIPLKFGDKFSKYMLEAKVSICSTIKENLLLYCRKFSTFVVVAIIKHFIITMSVSQRNSACNRNNFTIESLVTISFPFHDIFPSLFLLHVSVLLLPPSSLNYMYGGMKYWNTPNKINKRKVSNLPLLKMTFSRDFLSSRDILFKVTVSIN